MADFFLSNLKSTTTASQHSMKFPPCSAVIFYFIFSGAVFYTGDVYKRQAMTYKIVLIGLFIVISTIQRRIVELQSP